MKSLLILGLTGAGLVSALPPVRRDAEAADPVVTRSFVLGNPWGKREDPVKTRSVIFGDPFPTGLPVPIPTFALPPPFKREAEPQDEASTRSVVIGDPFPTEGIPVPLPTFALPPPFKREAEPADPVITRSFVLGGPFGKRAATDPVETRTPSTSDAASTRYPTSDTYAITRTPSSSDAASTRTPVTSDAASTRTPSTSDAASTRYPTQDTYAVTRSFTLPPVPLPTKGYPPHLEPRADYPASIQVVGITYGGTGCPSNDVSVVVGDEGETMKFSAPKSLHARIGKNIAITESRENCQLNLNLKYSSGWQYAVTASNFSGYAYLESGVTGVSKVTSYFSGQTAQV